MEKDMVRNSLKAPKKPIVTTKEKDNTISKDIQEQIKKEVLSIKININNKKIESTLEELRFGNNLDIDIEEIAEYHAFWATLAEESEEIYNNFKIDYEKWYAEQDTIIRNSAPPIGTKITESYISNKIKQLSEWIDKNKELNHWKKNANILKNAVARSLQMKKDMIQTKSANMRLEKQGDPDALENSLTSLKKKKN